jgi:hypothetical protein
MGIRGVRLLSLAAAGALALAGCSSSALTGEAAPADKAPAYAAASPDITGSIPSPHAAEPLSPPAPAPAAAPQTQDPLQAAILPFLLMGSGY